jgi:hypothetical protein
MSVMRGRPIDRSCYLNIYKLVYGMDVISSLELHSSWRFFLSVQPQATLWHRQAAHLRFLHSTQTSFQTRARPCTLKLTDWLCKKAGIQGKSG